MGMRMLIDATHLEETRVVVVKGTRLEEFDYETSTKQVLKGNIYLARVTRVEPSLQAAFVEYGGNRHGFLAFSEIHPDYYQIPIADREALLAQQAEEEAAAAAAEEAELAEEEARAAARAAAEAGADENGSGDDEHPGIEIVEGDFDTVEEISPDSPDASDASDSSEAAADATAESDSEPVAAPAYWNVPASAEPAPTVSAPVETAESDSDQAGEETQDVDHYDDAHEAAGEADASEQDRGDHEPGDAAAEADASADENGENGENGKSDDHEESHRRRRRANAFRRYKIQEVIKRRQIMLVQVVKEERGNKGAALTTYLSLAGRYCVLMPNTARGGGISRKIQSQADRKRLKAITSELDIPEGMGVIVRTAGMERSKQEIKRDFEYLLRSWDSIREMTLKSSAPALIYEEAGLIKRSIRDLYSDQIDEVLVEGEEGYRFAHDFMQMLMPSHADKVKLYQDKIPLFHRYQVEQQLDGMFSPTVQLKSGGYIVINPTEALVSIDVNSGKSTREHNIEETAFKTNLEAAEEIARQLRLRDLAGLVVIDFIDMEENRNIRKVEQRLKECLRSDRARIQVGRISAFGLLEMSRQRLRPSLIESSTMPCPHCQGRGYVRSIESTALQVLRAIEEEGIRDRSAEITVTVPTDVVIYLLNHKRDRIGDIERRYVMKVVIAADASLVPPDFRIERTKSRQPGDVNRPELKPEGQRPITQETAYAADADEEAASGEGDEAQERAESGDREGSEGGRRRRRRRRRGRRSEGGEQSGDEIAAADAAGEETEDGGDTAEAADADGAEGDDDQPQAAGGEDGEGDGRRRRRGRRGGRRRRRADGDEASPREADGEQPAPMMTPAAIGAMLDGLPSYEFEDEDTPAAPETRREPQPAPVSEPVQQPEAVQAAEPAEAEPAPADEAPAAEPAVAAEPAAPTETQPSAAAPAAPPVPETTGPVFQTVVIAPDGSAEQAEAPPPAPKKGWWRR
ncbi:MAG TPA: Rne/Rng family ribonuclease [Ferrovibrio sp.]|uniref:Rne/Rng family ribonuclease n=1 Tax=Ferrovibrio sp. TaxID=1917215 RepID=UPI002B4B8AA9|nr:Rne/Rng family ribonuclease [Ferrovibrio sp.]HLT75854.1 Rne/Rng family ribonuclease [Ferrovibrio sp.]